MVRLARGETLNLQGRILQPGRVRLRIYDLAGRRIATVADGQLLAGPYSFAWNGEGAGAGTYLVIAEVAGQTFRRKVVLIR